MSEKVRLDQERKNRYLDKVEKIEIRTADIEEWIGELSEADFERDKKTRLATYKAFQELVEAAADICAMYASDTVKAVGDDYENIGKAAGGLYPEGLREHLERSNGLRNRLVHEYNHLNNKIAHDSIKELLPSFKEFVRGVREWIKSK